MAIIELDLDKLQESGLFVEEYVVLQLIHSGLNPDSFKVSSKEIIPILEQNLRIKSVENGWELTSKALSLFQNKNTDINFDEFWDAFPVTTPDGRILRSANKIWNNSNTRDYTVCKKKYLSKVKSLEIHNKIVSIIKARVLSGDYKYINNLETYINQELWQRDVKYLNMNGQRRTVAR